MSMPRSMAEVNLTFNTLVSYNETIGNLEEVFVDYACAVG
jgi:hypothetical protein